MKKGFSIISILIIIGLLALIYLGYYKYIKNNMEAGLGQEANISTSTSETIEQIQPPKNGSAIKSAPKSILPSVIQNSPKEEKTAQPAQSEPVEPEEPTTQNGLYENTTYNYEITCPPAWPLKVISEDNVSIGTVPPKNGQGAITIEISSQGSNEIQQAKNEAKKYPGVIEIKEESIILSGVSGTKMTMSNLLNKITNIYIILEKNGWHYAIKYSEESASFVNQVEVALATFKFTK